MPRVLETQSKWEAIHRVAALAFYASRISRQSATSPRTRFKEGL